MNLTQLSDKISYANHKIVIYVMDSIIEPITDQARQVLQCSRKTWLILQSYTQVKQLWNYSLKIFRPERDLNPWPLRHRYSAPPIWFFMYSLVLQCYVMNKTATYFMQDFLRSARPNSSETSKHSGTPAKHSAQGWKKKHRDCKC